MTNDQKGENIWPFQWEIVQRTVKYNLEPWTINNEY